MYKFILVQEHIDPAYKKYEYVDDLTGDKLIHTTPNSITYYYRRYQIGTIFPNVDGYFYLSDNSEPRTMHFIKTLYNLN
jgi:hypothetical protein